MPVGLKLGESLGRPDDLRNTDHARRAQGRPWLGWQLWERYPESLRAQGFQKAGFSSCLLVTMLIHPPRRKCTFPGGRGQAAAAVECSRRNTFQNSRCWAGVHMAGLRGGRGAPEEGREKGPQVASPGLFLHTLLNRWAP